MIGPQLKLPYPADKMGKHEHSYYRVSNHEILIEFGWVTIEVFWNFVAVLHIIFHEYEATLISHNRTACC